MAGSQASGDLPATVQVVADGAAGSTDEGRAMAEIIYDLAPGMSKLVFATANGGPASKAQRIKGLADAGAKVIADDTSYPLEPFFQDGVVSQAIDAVKARGVAYFASAGNQGRASWEGTFKPTNGGAAGPGNFHDFGSGRGRSGPEDRDGAAGRLVHGLLQWDEPFGATVTDLDAYIVDPVDHTILGGDETDNLQLGMPVAALSFTNNGAQARAIGIAFNRFAGTRTPFVKYMVVNNFDNDLRIEDYATNSGTIGPDSAGAKGALAVAAVRPTIPEPTTPRPSAHAGPCGGCSAPRASGSGRPRCATSRRSPPPIGSRRRCRASRRSPARARRRRTRRRSRR